MSYKTLVTLVIRQPVGLYTFSSFRREKKNLQTDRHSLLYANYYIFSWFPCPWEVNWQDLSQTWHTKMYLHTRNGFCMSRHSKVTARTGVHTHSDATENISPNHASQIHKAPSTQRLPTCQCLLLAVNYTVTPPISSSQHQVGGTLDVIWQQRLAMGLSSTCLKRMLILPSWTSPIRQ